MIVCLNESRGTSFNTFNSFNSHRAEYVDQIGDWKDSLEIYNVIVMEISKLINDATSF